MTTSKLVELHNNKPMTDSLLVSNKFSKRHDNVVRDIRNLDCSDLFQSLNFEESIYTKNGKEYPILHMTRDGFMFLCMGFTGKKAAQWKELYISAFNEMEHQLLQLQVNKFDHQWLAQREQTKALRCDETDVIKEFVEYAKNQGSTKAGWYYKLITSATYKALNLIQSKQPKLRDTLDSLQLSFLVTAEAVAQSSLKKYMSGGFHYKEIFKLVCRDLESFAEPLMLMGGDYDKSK